MHQSTTRPIIKFNLLRARFFVFTRILNAVSLTFEPTRNHGDHACNHRKPSVQDGFQEHHNSSNSAHPCGSSSSACLVPRHETITWPARSATSLTLSAVSERPERTTNGDGNGGS